MRVQISHHSFSSLFAKPERAEFVSLADVHITCVPLVWSEDQTSELPEIAWEKDPAEFEF
jgi:hypothetical protein